MKPRSFIVVLQNGVDYYEPTRASSVLRKYVYMFVYLINECNKSENSVEAYSVPTLNSADIFMRPI